MFPHFFHIIHLKMGINLNILKSLNENQKEITALFYITCSHEEQNYFILLSVNGPCAPTVERGPNSCLQFLFNFVSILPNIKRKRFRVVPLQSFCYWFQVFVLNSSSSGEEMSR